jgi:hypothetical protein
MDGITRQFPVRAQQQMRHGLDLADESVLFRHAACIPLSRYFRPLSAD